MKSDGLTVIRDSARLFKRVVRGAIKLSKHSFMAQWVKDYQFNKKLRVVRAHQKRELERVRKKKIIDVVFFVIHGAVWKYDTIYKLMERDEKFNPVILICPYTVYGKKAMIEEMNQSFDSFNKKGYNVVKTYNEESDSFIDVKKEMDPDILCFTNPWNITRGEYLIEQYLDKLTCYVPYGYKCSHLHSAHYNKPMQNFAWKFFIETQTHKDLALIHARNGGKNIEVTGYPGMDKLLDHSYVPADPWKVKSDSLKRIIWAPHHSIPGDGAGLDYSTFMKYHQFFLEIADKYKNDIQIAFKPHPILKQKLKKSDVWGEEKTDSYFNQWKNLDNGLLAEGDYIDLFATSDALLHDGASFLIDYLYTKKPVIYLVRDKDIKKRFNLLGKKSFECHYHAYHKNDIEKFIEMVISGKDEKLKDRQYVFNKYVKPHNHSTASENIYNSIKQRV